MLEELFARSKSKTQKLKENTWSLPKIIQTVLFLVLCLPSFLAASESKKTPYSTGKEPAWVKPSDFSLEAIPVKPSQGGLQHLLIDTQRNWEKKTFYSHFVVKALNPSGIQRISQIQIDFDPTYRTVMMHVIRIFRNGKWYNKLLNAQHHLIQRERELEQNLYLGDLTLVYLLDDVQEGDIVEYSYSLIGSHPLFSSHYTDKIYLQRDVPVEKITHRLLAHPDLSFAIKPVNTTITPQIKNLSPSVQEWSWEAMETPPYPYESDRPSWANLPAHIEVSQYRGWDEVVQKLYPLYVLPHHLPEYVSSEMQALVNEWKGSTQDPGERALLALRFVQDKIRYLGIEEGMRGMRPTNPRLTFQRRFGDCKDKTLLLHTLLQLMDIPSKPLLVCTNTGKRLPDILPSATAFDHIALQLQIGEAIYWVETTLTLQGGKLQTNYFPDYAWGLLLSGDSKELTPLPQAILTKPTKLDTFLKVESPDSACLKIQTLFHDFKADRMRRVSGRHGLEKINDEFLADIQKVYGAASLDSPVEVLDNREENTITFIESYHLPTQALSDQKILEIFSYILKHCLDDDINPERSSPYELTYPLWVQENIRIDNPFTTWKVSHENYLKEHESFTYSLSTHIQPNHAEFTLELKHLQDHIPVHSIKEYWAAVNEINRKAPPKMIIASPPNPLDKISSPLCYTMLGLCLWPLIRLLSRKTTRFLKFLKN